MAREARMTKEIEDILENSDVWPVVDVHRMEESHGFHTLPRTFRYIVLKRCNSIREYDRAPVGGSNRDL